MDIQPINYLSDFSGVIPDQDEPKINLLIRQYKKITGVEIAIVILPTLGEEVDIDEYAQLLFDRWGIGEQDINNGVLLIITTEDGMLRLQPGYGLEDLLTDADSRKIEDDSIVPALTNEKWENGVVSAIDCITKKFGNASIDSLKQAYKEKKAKEEKEFEEQVFKIIKWTMIIIILFVFAFLISNRRKKKNDW